VGQDEHTVIISFYKLTSLPKLDGLAGKMDSDLSEDGEEPSDLPVDQVNQSEDKDPKKESPTRIMTSEICTDDQQQSL